MRVVLPVLLLVLSTSCDNGAPSRPIVFGPTRARPGDSLLYRALSVDPDGDSVRYRFQWGDGNATEWSRWHFPGRECTTRHSFADTGVHEVSAQARDAGQETEWSSGVPVAIREYRPMTPYRPLVSGPDTVPVGDTVKLGSKASHALGERVSVRFLLGQTDTTLWSVLVHPDTFAWVRHIVNAPGIFALRAQATDESGYLSGWSEPETLVVVGSLSR